jgi:hypothetical protein
MPRRTTTVEAVTAKNRAIQEQVQQRELVAPLFGIRLRTKDVVSRRKRRREARDGRKAG